MAEATDWTDQTLPERLRACARMLYYHGCITEAEMPKVAKRVEARISKLEGEGHEPA